MELNYRGQRSLGKITPPPTCPTCLIMEPSVKCLRLTNAVCPPPPFASCIITKIPIMKILSASQPPSPHFPFPPFCPPAHCLAHSRWRKFIKMKLRLQLTGFIKIYLPLTDTMLFVYLLRKTKRTFLNNLRILIRGMLWTHECVFSHKIHLLICFCPGGPYSVFKEPSSHCLMLFSLQVGYIQCQQQRALYWDVGK